MASWVGTDCVSGSEEATNHTVDTGTRTPARISDDAGDASDHRETTGTGSVDSNFGSL